LPVPQSDDDYSDVEDSSVVEVKNDRQAAKARSSSDDDYSSSDNSYKEISDAEEVIEDFYN
jgi:hypothetical protein